MEMEKVSFLASFNGEAITKRGFSNCRVPDLFSRIKLQTHVWRCSGGPKVTTPVYRKMPPAPAREYH
jgi:hypothetical protein